MAVSPERELPQPPEGVKEIPETLPQRLEKGGGVRVRPSQITAQVHDKRGQPLTQSQATRIISIQLPSDKTSLISWAKGPVTESLTWFANFWLRILKKAVHFKWKVVNKQQ